MMSERALTRGRASSLFDVAARLIDACAPKKHTAPPPPRASPPSDAQSLNFVASPASTEYHSPSSAFPLTPSSLSFPLTHSSSSSPSSSSSVFSPSSSDFALARSQSDGARGISRHSSPPLSPPNSTSTSLITPSNVALCAHHHHHHHHHHHRQPERLERDFAAFLAGLPVTDAALLQCLEDPSLDMFAFVRRPDVARVVALNVEVQTFLEDLEESVIWQHSRVQGGRKVGYVAVRNLVRRLVDLSQMLLQ